MVLACPLYSSLWMASCSSFQKGPKLKGQVAFHHMPTKNNHMPHWLIHFSKAMGLFFSISTYQWYHNTLLNLHSTSSAVWHFNRVIPKSLCHLVIHLLFLSRVYSSDITDKLCVGVKVTVPGCVKEHTESKDRSSWVCMSVRKRRESEQGRQCERESKRKQRSMPRNNGVYNATEKKGQLLVNLG